MEKMALARLRQLSAHEVGHTLGLSHNYAASTRNRASVMDYPHPYVSLGRDGVPDLSDAYATGIGEWDKATIAYGYSDLPQAERTAILERAHRAGLYFLTDADARPPGSASPSAHLWDSGPNAIDELKRLLDVRAAALERFGLRNIREGIPVANLEDVLVPLYLSHRYQAEAAAKALGGLDYRFALRGDGQKIAELVPAAEQRRALEALIAAVQPEVLVLPERVLQLLPPRAHSYPRTRENFRSRTGLTFDAFAPAESAARIVAGLLLNPDRAARLVQYHARDAKLPGFDEVAQRLMAATWKAPRKTGQAGEVQRVIEQVVLNELLTLAANESAAAQARAIALLTTQELERWIRAQPEGSTTQRAHYSLTLDLMRRFRDDPKQWNATRLAEPPPGQPIGCSDLEWIDARF
jgi:hypothetical protein